MSLKEFIEASRVLAIAHFRAESKEGKAKLLAAQLYLNSQYRQR